MPEKLSCMATAGNDTTVILTDRPPLRPPVQSTIAVGVPGRSSMRFEQPTPWWSPPAQTRQEGALVSDGECKMGGLAKSTTTAKAGACSRAGDPKHRCASTLQLRNYSN